MNLAGATLTALAQRAGVTPADVDLWLGPSIAQCSYEVGDELREHFDERFLRKRDHGKWELDVSGAVVADLRSAGADMARVCVSAVDTFVDRAACYSYRRDGAASGRMLSFARWM